MVKYNTTENGEDGVEKTNKSNENLELKFRKDFIFETLKNKKDSKDKNFFIEDLITSKKIDGKLATELEEFKNKHIEEYTTIELKNITSLGLQSLVAKDFASLERERNTFKEIVLFNYDIDSNNYDSIISNKIKGLSAGELIELYNSEIKLENFLNKKNNFKLSNRIKIKVLSNIGEDTYKRLEKLDNDNKKQIIEILQKLEYNLTIKDSDFKFIFLQKDLSGDDLLKPEEKKEIISNFIPFISIDKAVKFGILTEEESDIRLIKEAKKILKNSEIDSDLVDFLLKYFKKDEILISTADIDNIDHIDIIANEIGFKKFEKNIKELSNNEREEIIKNGPKNLNELAESLKLYDKSGNRFQNLLKFKDQNIIEISKKNLDGEYESSYIKIVSNNEKEKSFNFVSISNKSGININNDSEINTINYIEFLNKFKSNDVKLNFFTKKEIELDLESGKLNKYGLDILTETTLTEDKKNILRNEYENSIKNDIENIQNKIKENGGEENNTQLVEVLNKKIEKLNNIGIITNQDLIFFYNFNNLKLKLDEIDKDGKDIMSINGEKGLFKGMILKTSKEGIFEIDGISEEVDESGLLNGVISIKNSAGQIENLGFNDFFEAFKKHDTKRLKPILNFSELINGNSSDIKNWNDHEFIDGKLVAKNVEDGDEKGDREVEYLVGNKTDKLIRIDNISGNKVTIQIGERKNNSELTKDELKNGKYKKNKDGKYEGETLFISGAIKHTISLNQLDELIKEDNLYPDWQIGKEIKQKSPKNDTNNFNSSFPSWLFSHTSISELIAGGKLFFNSIEETLKKGNELHSAQAALSLGIFLPKELRQDLKIKVERAEGEAMDKELESLGKVDSRIAVERIESWLLNKNCPEHKKEAGLLFMLEKYGHLTSKKALYQYRGKYLWYEAFGGKINDEFFLKIKKETEEDDVTFSEENLMHRFLKMQCGKNGFAGHKRRSRLHKEFEGKWAAGIEGEIEKGYKDASAKRTARTMVTEGLIAEAAGGTTNNAIGWFKKAIERGGSLEDMQEGFFCLLYSGALYDIDQKTFMRIKGIFDDGVPIMMMRFSTKLSEMHLFNDTVLELSKRMEEVYGGNIYKDAKKLHTDALEKNGTEKQRLEKTQDFWKKYGKQLSNALNLANTDSNEYAQTDKIIILEKDKNKKFDEYFETLKGFVDENKFGSDYMDEDCGEVGLTGLGIGKLTKKYLKLNTTRQLSEGKTGPRIWKEFYKDLSSITKKKFYVGDDDQDGEKDKALKRKYLLHFLKELSFGFLGIAASDILKSYNDSGTDIGKTLNAIGLNLYDISKQFSPGDILKTDVADKILINVANNIINGALDGGLNTDKFNNPLDQISNPVKNGTNKILDDQIDWE